MTQSVAENVTEGQPPFDVVEFTSNLLKDISENEDQAKKSQEVLDHICKGGCLSDVYGLTADDLEIVYGMARTLYNNRKYDEALTVFEFLVFVEHNSNKYWMGLGAVRQMMGNFEKALEAYGMATLYDIDDPKPQLQAGFCLIKLGHKDEAIAALEGAMESRNATESTNIQASALLARLQDQPGSASA